LDVSIELLVFLHQKEEKNSRNFEIHASNNRVFKTIRNKLMLNHHYQHELSLIEGARLSRRDIPFSKLD